MAPHIGRLLPQAACATTRNSPNPGQPLLRDSGYYTVFGGRTKRDEMRCHCSHDGGHPWAVVVGRSLLLSHVQSVRLVGGGEQWSNNCGPPRLHEVAHLCVVQTGLYPEKRGISCISGKNPSLWQLANITQPLDHKNSPTVQVSLRQKELALSRGANRQSYRLPTFHMIHQVAQ